MKPNTKLGVFEVSSALGAGGMGEVWRATDTRLGREVALKILPPDFAEDANRHARFEREARVLASLNHPNIATLFGLEHLDGQHVLVMELVEGEGLDERIARGPIPVDEAVAMALQVAEALEAAHEAGIVHRDLKPANIRLRTDGTVKVLDFGLAKTWDEETADVNSSLSPTITRHQTAAGLILGTAAYMAPEQAAGQRIDRRADIWAFGVVVWEMLTGSQLFGGETISHVLASVLKDDIDLEVLPVQTPPRIRELVERCLRKDLRQRLQSVGDARIVLEEWLRVPEAPAVAADPTRPSEGRGGPLRMMPWVAAGVLAVALGFTGWSLWTHVPEVFQATIPPPDAAFYLNPASPGPVTVSPNGTMVAFSAEDTEGTHRLWVRNLRDRRARALTGTEGAGYPFWSPDSRSLGFFIRGDEGLKKIDVTGGPPVTVCAANNGKGGSWNEAGVIIFAPGADTAIHRVSADGGPSEAVTELGKGQRSHRHPRFLPDGDHFLYFSRGAGTQSGAIKVGSLSTGESQEVMLAESQGEFAAGHLLFVREGTLMAQAFDPKRFEFIGPPRPLVEEVLMVQGAALSVFSTSEHVLAFQSGTSETSTVLEWRDRSGGVLGTLGDGAYYRTAVVSPDGRHAVTQIFDLTTGMPDLWIYDIERQVRTRFTFSDGSEYSPVWAPDSETVYFASNPDDSWEIFRKTIGGAGEVELVLSTPDPLRPTSVSPDGRFLVFTRETDDTRTDLLVLPLDGSEGPSVLRETQFNDSNGVVSPDGRWMLFVSNDSGPPHVFVTTFPTPGRRWQLSNTEAGVYPQWSDGGREVIYTGLSGQLMRVEISTEGDSVSIGTEEPLFEIQPPLLGGAYFSVSDDPDRFLVVPSGLQETDTFLNLFVNWRQVLEAR